MRKREKKRERVVRYFRRYSEERKKERELYGILDGILRERVLVVEKGERGLCSVGLCVVQQFVTRWVVRQNILK
jgi:hypothetical protein